MFVIISIPPNYCNLASMVVDLDQVKVSAESRGYALWVLFLV